MDLQNQDPSFVTQHNRRKRQSLQSTIDNEEYDTTNLQQQQQRHPTKTRKLIPIPSSFEYNNVDPILGCESDVVLAPVTVVTNQNIERNFPKEEIITIVTQNNTVEERVRARSLLLQQSSNNTSTVTHASKTTTTTTTNSTNSTLDPQLIIHVTDALWSYLITTNFRQQQIMQQKHRHSSQRESSTIENKETNLFVAKTTRNGVNQNQNLILKDVVNELRRTIQAKSLGKSVNKMNMIQGIQGVTTTSTTTGSNSSSITKRDIVHVLLELHINPIYQQQQQWVTLLDPNTMHRVVLGEKVGMEITTNGSDYYIPPNTIVQIDHSTPYQSIRKHLLSLL